MSGQQKKKKRDNKSRHLKRRKARAERLFAEPLEFIDSPEFHADDAADEILGPPPEPPQRPRVPKPPPGLPPYLESLYRFPLLSAEQEQYYFRKLNFLKCRASELRDSLSSSRPSVRKMKQIERDLRDATEIKNLLTRRNLRLVVSIARKFLRPGGNFFELVSDGNIALMRAVEKFDYSRGFKFSTYATWAIRRMLARSVPSEQKQLSRFRTGIEEPFAAAGHEGESLYAQERVNAEQKDYLRKILRKLDTRERDILSFRFGLKRGTEPQTLQQVGDELGVSKERIRQIEQRALKKLREMAEGRPPDIALAN